MDKQFKEVIDKLIQAETDGLRNLALIDVEYPRQLAHYVATAFFDVYHDKQKLSAERAKVIEHVTVAVRAGQHDHAWHAQKALTAWAETFYHRHHDHLHRDDTLDTWDREAETLTLQLREHAADQLAGLALTLKELGERYPGDSAWILARYKALAGTFVLMHYKIKELLPLLGASLPNHKFDPNFDAIGWSLFDDIRRQLLP